MKQVSVIILNWNGVALLRRYLPSVLANTSPDLAEVIVADNGSSDGSLDVLRAEFPEVTIYAFEQNYGFAEGYNKALAMTESPYTVLLNSDVAVAPHWLEPLVAYAEAHPQVAALQPKLLSDRDRSEFEYAGAAGGYLDNMGYPYCRGRIFSAVETDRGQYDTVQSVMWTTGACFFVRTALYLLVGGLDANFFAHMEEIDLCWRLRRSGFQLVCVPQSVAYHLGGASLAMGHPRKTYLNFRNSLLMLWKNLPASDRRSYLLKRKCLDFLAALNFLRQGEFSHVRAIVEAHRDASRMIREIYAPADRGQIEWRDDHPVNLSFREGRISILAAFYLKRKQKYSDLF